MIGIHLITGEKGNVGKSLFSNALEDYLFSVGVQLNLFDAAFQAQTFSLTHPQATCLMFSDDSELSRQPDRNQCM